MPPAGVLWLLSRNIFDVAIRPPVASLKQKIDEVKIGFATLSRPACLRYQAFFPDLPQATFIISPSPTCYLAP